MFGYILDVNSGNGREKAEESGLRRNVREDVKGVNGRDVSDTALPSAAVGWRRLVLSVTFP